jgi:hypothetical protein
LEQRLDQASGPQPISDLPKAESLKHGRHLHIALVLTRISTQLLLIPEFVQFVSNARAYWNSNPTEPSTPDQFSNYLPLTLKDVLYLILKTVLASQPRQLLYSQTADFVHL